MVRALSVGGIGGWSLMVGVYCKGGRLLVQSQFTGGLLVEGVCWWAESDGRSLMADGICWWSDSNDRRNLMV